MTWGVDDRRSLADCEAHARRFVASGDPVALEAALAAFAVLPAHLPRRRRLAAFLVVAQLTAADAREPFDWPRAVELADIADKDPDPVPDWPVISATVRAMDLMSAVQVGRPGLSPWHALAEVDRLGVIVGGRHPYRTMVDMARTTIRGHLAAHDRDVAGARQVVGETSRFEEAMPPGSPERIRMEAMSFFMDAFGRMVREDVEGAVASLASALTAAAGLPPTDPARLVIEGEIDSLRPLLQTGLPGGLAVGRFGPGRLRGDGVESLEPQMAAQIDALEANADAAGLSDTERAIRVADLGSALLMVAFDNRAGIERAIVRLEQAVELSPAHDPRRPDYLGRAGIAHVRIHDLEGDRAALRRGTALLEQARELAGTTAHAQWAMAALPLGHAYRMAGQLELGRRTAATALRGYAWSALLQSDPAEVSDAARRAAADAVQIARMCLADSDVEAAASTLDAGRGLMLYAATETRSLSDRLDAIGEPGLAREWQEEVARVGPTGASPQLRRRVIAAVAGIPIEADGTMTSSPSEGSARLLDPPGPDEVRAALTALDLDALVYLMPGDRVAGAAIVVPRDSPPIALALPELNATEEFDRLVVAMSEDAGRVRDADVEPDHDATARAARRLDDVCDWAWRVAIGPLLERGIDRPPGRPPRIVLIPVRELALVPWHAASRPVGGRTRYAVEDVVFSYAASARLLCDVAWAPTVSLGDGGLFVGDPDAGATVADLPAARAEALAVSAAFYPGATYVGRRGDGSEAAHGAGTRHDLLNWLADPAGGALLHLACHGVVRTGGSDGPHSGESHLLLARGERLAAGELLRRAATDTGRVIGLVVLAACRSGVPARGYDEAFSLATTFLASGVGSAISAQWSVPDSSTSVLMFMFHHYLRHDRMRPVDALRAAQLWMLSDDSEPPPSMPPPLRELHTGRPDVAAWAGFIHTGR